MGHDFRHGMVFLQRALQLATDQNEFWIILIIVVPAVPRLSKKKLSQLMVVALPSGNNQRLKGNPLHVS